jgi:hypothetical protein
VELRTTLLRLLIAVQFSLLAPRIVYTLQSWSAAPPAAKSEEPASRRSSSDHRPVVEDPGDDSHPAAKKK